MNYLIENQVDVAISVGDVSSDILSKNKEKITRADKTRLSELKTALGELRSPEGTYEQPMLTDQIKYLYNMMNKADQEIGKDALDRFADLQSKFGTIQQSINQWF